MSVFSGTLPAVKDGPQPLAFREDGSFRVDGVPAGSYVLEIANTDYIFEPVRVDITSKGKMRARKLNTLQVCALLAVCFLCGEHTVII